MIRLTAVIEIAGGAPRALTHESNARSFVIGRDESADFQIPLATISRRHVKIFESDNVYVVEDLGSTHGTLINGKKLGKGEKKVLRNGDILELTKAKVTCSIESDKVADAVPNEGTQAIAARAVQGILGRLGESQSEGPFLRVISGADEGMRFPLSGSLSEWTMGRSKDCELVLNDANVSRRHAVVKKDWNGFTVSDLGSKNGVIVNDALIKKPRRLKDHDELTIGPITLVFVDPDAELLASLKDVPGFATPPEEDKDEPAPLEGSASPVGAPDGGAQPEPMPDGAPASEEDELANIDPSLLVDARTRLPTEWIVIALVGLLILGAVGVLLFVVL